VDTLTGLIVPALLGWVIFTLVRKRRQAMEARSEALAAAEGGRSAASATAGGITLHLHFGGAAGAGIDHDDQHHHDDQYVYDHQYLDDHDDGSDHHVIVPVDVRAIRRPDDDLRARALPPAARVPAESGGVADVLRRGRGRARLAHGDDGVSGW
jgi:hypothetical protein